MDSVIVIGAGGHGKVVLDILRAHGVYAPAGFIDDNPALAGATVANLPVLGRLADLSRLYDQGVRHAVIAIGDNATRLRYADDVRRHGFDFVTAVHPTAFVSPTALLGPGVVVAPHATIITEARVADLAVVNTSAVVDHECVVGEGAHVGPGALLAGRVRVGRGVFIGMGAKVIQGRTVGDFTVVGAGAVVTRDLPDHCTAVGVPAHVIKTAPPPTPPP